jgi:hypothetical protein
MIALIAARSGPTFGGSQSATPAQSPNLKGSAVLDGCRSKNPQQGRKVPQVSNRIREYPAEHRIGAERQRDGRDGALHVGGRCFCHRRRQIHGSVCPRAVSVEHAIGRRKDSLASRHAASQDHFG